MTEFYVIYYFHQLYNNNDIKPGINIFISFVNVYYRCLLKIELNKFCVLYYTETYLPTFISIL